MPLSWNKLLKWMEHHVLIVTDAVEGAVINPVREKDCNALPGLKETNIRSASNSTWLTFQMICALCWWQELWVVACHWTTSLNDDDVCFIAHTLCLIYAAVPLWTSVFSKLNCCHFSFSPGKWCLECNGTLHISHEQQKWNIEKWKRLCVLGVRWIPASGEILDCIVPRRWITFFWGTWG